MNYELLLRKARNVLKPLWEEAQMKGSTCWGPKSAKNPHSGSNLVFRVGDEIITVSQPADRLIIQEFQKTTNTKLGQRASELFRRAGLMIRDREEIFSLSGFTWLCSACKQKGKVNPGILEEVDSRGEGAGEAISEAYCEHEKLSPGCNPKNVDFYDKNLIKQVDLKQVALALLERVG